MPRLKCKFLITLTVVELIWVAVAGHLHPQMAVISVLLVALCWLLLFYARKVKEERIKAEAELEQKLAEYIADMVGDNQNETGSDKGGSS